MDDLLFLCRAGCDIGGRIGYTLFYGMANLLEDPFLCFASGKEECRSTEDCWVC